MNWTTILVAFIAATPPTIAAIAALMVAKNTHKLVNSRMDELLRLTRKEATEQATDIERARAKMENGENGDKIS